MSFVSNWFKHPRFRQVASGQGLIRRSHRGEPVKTLQKALIKLGHSMPVSTAKTGSPDGIFGAETDQCVRQFQRSAIANESPDGKVGPITLKHLDERLRSIPAPDSSGLIWGRAPSNVPGSPEEADLGYLFGYSVAVRQKHQMACWAACLSFWARYCGGGRPRLDQDTILRMYSDYVVDQGSIADGGISLSNLRGIVRGESEPLLVKGGLENPKWQGYIFDQFPPSSFTPDWLEARTNNINKAIYLGYKINGAPHINVVGHYDFDGTSFVWVMEPWVGRFKLRNFDYYQQADRLFYMTP